MRAAALLALAVAALAALTGCSRAAEPPPPASLDDLLALGEYEAILDAAVPRLLAAQERGAPLAECWELERVRLLALARLGRADQLVEAWPLANATYSAVVPPRFGAQLAAELRAVDPSGTLARRFIVEGLRPGRASLAPPPEWLRQVEPMSNPYGHPEGFPKAWLAPDERREER